MTLIEEQEIDNDKDNRLHNTVKKKTHKTMTMDTRQFSDSNNKGYSSNSGNNINSLDTLNKIQGKAKYELY